MRVLFASDYPHVPENLGGVEFNTHELALALIERGHQPIVLSSLVGRGMVGLLARVRLAWPGNPGWAEDRTLGYPTLRSVAPAKALDAVIAQHSPDVVVVQSWRLDMVAKALGHGRGAVLYCHNANTPYADTVGGDWARRSLLLANSGFCAGVQQEALGMPFGVMPPLVRPDRYLVGGPRSHVIHVGINGAKGAAVTLEVARARPDIPFVMVRTWPGLRLGQEDAALLADAEALPNVRIMQPQHDARRIYRLARAILVPSRWAETWGRVVTEAQINGIPVIASDRGGLPESVGEGGILLDPGDDPAPWVAAVGRVWDDPNAHATWSGRSLARVARPDVAFAPLLDRFLSFMNTAIARRAA